MRLGKKSPNGGTLSGNPNVKPPYNNSSHTQRARMLSYLKIYSCLSTMQARNEMGILHPSGRVMELRAEGHNIETFWIEKEDSNGVIHRIGLYVYRGSKQEVRNA